MKKLLYLLLCFSSCLCWGQEKVGDFIEQGGIRYRVTKSWDKDNSHGDVVVTYWDSLRVGKIMRYNIEKKYEGIIVLPKIIYIESIDGKRHQYTNKGIDKHAFEGCTNLIYTMLTYLMTYIGDRAFYGCKWLQVADLSTPTEQLYVGNEAFAKCTALRYVDMRNEHRYGEKVFAGCPNIELILTRYIGDYNYARYPISMFDESVYSDAVFVRFDNPKYPKEFYKRNDCWQQFRYAEFRKSNTYELHGFNFSSSADTQKRLYSELTGEKFPGLSDIPTIKQFDYTKVKRQNLFPALTNSYSYIKEKKLEIKEKESIK